MLRERQSLRTQWGEKEEEWERVAMRKELKAARGGEGARCEVGPNTHGLAAAGGERERRGAHAAQKEHVAKTQTARQVETKAGGRRKTPKGKTKTLTRERRGK